MKHNKLPKNEVICGLLQRYGMEVNRTQIKEFIEETGIAMPYWITDRPKNRLSHGLYTLEHLIKEHNIDISNIVVAESTANPAPKAGNSFSEEDQNEEKSDAEIAFEIRGRFSALSRFAHAMVDQKVRAMIVSGNPGIGKTHTLEDIMDAASQRGDILYKSVKGYVRATGLYKLMWDMRFENCVLLFDDADNIFQDEVALNLLKQACDSSKRRNLAWLSERSFKDEGGDEIPDSFEFRGSIIFITNLDFDRMSRSNARLAPHFQALISRSFYLDLNLLSAREMLVRIEDVVKNSTILYEKGLNEIQSEFILAYMRENAIRLRDLSLRTVMKLGDIFNAAKNEDDFLNMARATCMKR
jgi:DNA replication protein DnaC